MDPLLAALKSSAEPTRLRLLVLLSHGEATVSELCRILGQSQPRVSRHLKLLTDAHLVNRYPEGSWVFYRLADGPIASSFLPSLLLHVNYDDARLISDRDRLQTLRSQRATNADEYFREVAGQWNAIRSFHIDESHVERAILDALGPAPLGNLLDIGTGTGRMLELLGPRAERALGVDTNHEMLRVARAALDRSGQSQVQARFGDMYRLPSPAASQDLVIIHQVLHFADEPLAVITEAARVLRPDGRLLIVDFAPHQMEALRSTHQHRRLGFPEEEVTGWCAAAGLSGGVAARLAGNPLTVLLWLSRKAREPLSLQPSRN